jgi:mannose-6-phosphate isomerase-like protein (cupin superfamily)
VPILRPGEGVRLSDRHVVKLERPEIAFLEYTVGPEYEGAGLHFHRDHVDAFFILDGEFEFTVGTETVQAGPGTSVAVPPGAVHAFRKTSSGSAHFLNMHAPENGFVAYLRRRLRGDEFDLADYDIYDVDEADGPAEAFVVRPGEGERFERASGLVITSLAPLPQISLFELAFDAGWSGVDAHSHDDHVDSFFVLDGEVEFTVDGKTARVGSGMFVAAPPNVVHGFRPVGPASFLNVHAPDGGFAEGVRGRR